MAKFVLQELPKGMGNGENLVFPKMDVYSMLDFQTVLKHMTAHDGSFSSSAYKAVLEVFAEVMKSVMCEGHSIKIDGLGIFSLSLGLDESTKSAEAAKEGRRKSVKKQFGQVYIKGINFKPDAKLLAEMNKEANLEQSATGIQKPNKNTLSYQEKVAKANELLNEKGYFTLYDFTVATGLCRTAASTELKKIVADTKSGVATRGSHSHKVWVKA